MSDITSTGNVFFTAFNTLLFFIFIMFNIHVYIYVCIYTYVYVHLHGYIYIYIYTVDYSNTFGTCISTTTGQLYFINLSQC